MVEVSFNKICFWLLLLVLCQGCSTLRTAVGDSQEHASIVYSGVRLNDFYWHCGLNGEYPYQPNWPGNPWLIPYFSFDYIFSLMADTVLIPVSIYVKTKDDGEFFPKIECSKLAPYFG
jgi:uncharacterized protein YceK